MRVGILGAGYMAGIHIPAIRRSGGNRVVAITDTDPQRLEETAKRFGIKSSYTDFNLMLEEEIPDVVHVLTPPKTHAELAIRAMEGGAHVLIEKPMTCGVEDAEKIIAVSKRNSVNLCVNHNLLFDPLTVKAMELVRGGRIGKLVHVDVHYTFDLKKNLDPYTYNDSHTHWAYSLPGGPLQDLAPHPISLLLGFIGEPVKIWPVSKNKGIMPMGLPDELKVLVDAGDKTGFISMSFGTKPDDLIAIDIYGTEMTVNVNLSNMTFFIQKTKNVPKKISKNLDNLDRSAKLVTGTFTSTLKFLTGGIPAIKGAAPLIGRFYESLRNNEEPPVAGTNGKSVVAFISEIWGEPRA